MASVRDIASLTNVSPATVSKVINGRPGVNAETAKTVRQALERTNYQPAFKAIDWNRILVVTPSYPSITTNSTYIPSILAGVTEQAFSLGVSLSIKKLPGHIDTVADMKQMLLQDGSAGVILLALRDGHQFANLLGMERLPHVVVGKTVHQSNINEILLDDDVSAAHAMTQLIEEGHQRIGVILGSYNETGHLQRLKACKQTMQQMLGNKGMLYEFATPCTNIEFGRQVLRNLRNHPDPPTALFCFDHPAAIGILQEARLQGCHIPDQLSLVSYVNDGTQFVLDFPLTSLQVPTYNMGRQAVFMLQKQLKKKTADKILEKKTGKRPKASPQNQTTLILPSRWVQGATTAPPKPLATVKWTLSGHEPHHTLDNLNVVNLCTDKKIADKPQFPVHPSLVKGTPCHATP